jgi:dienelactone hydrolase
MTTTFDITKRAAAAFVAAVALVPPVLSVSPAAAAVTAQSGFALPAPSGRYAVGRDVLHLVDQSRPDPWVPEDRRELMVSMYYPAAAGTGRPAAYLTTTEASLFIEARAMAGVEPEALGGTRTAARGQAQPRWGRYPLVILTPGITLHRHTLTHLAEELASRGYVVASVDHAYESVGTAFPGGRVLACTACTVLGNTDEEDQPAAIAGLATGRAQDITFLLDRLTAATPAWRHAGLIDRGRIGMAGHSIGGNATAATMATDSRVDAGLNMDGTFFAPVPADGLNGRPFLLLGTPAHSPGGADVTWDRDWRSLDGWKRWLTVTGTEHFDYSDIAVLADQAGLPDTASPLPGDRTAQIVRDYVGAFFDLHLRGIARPLLDGPDAGHPEVVFHQP